MEKIGRERKGRKMDERMIDDDIDGVVMCTISYELQVIRRDM